MQKQRNANAKTQEMPKLIDMMDTRMYT